jgi:hypothetical protein
LKKQEAEKEATKEVAEKEATEKEAVKKEAAEKEVAEKEDDDDDEDQCWRPSESSDDNVPICFNHLYRHNNNLFFHIKYMMTDEFSLPNMVERHRQLNKLIKAAICDP